MPAFRDVFGKCETSCCVEKVLKGCEDAVTRSLARRCQTSAFLLKERGYLKGKTIDEDSKRSRSGTMKTIYLREVSMG